jgi:hypothetical protein
MGLAVRKETHTTMGIIALRLHKSEHSRLSHKSGKKNM